MTRRIALFAALVALVAACSTTHTIVGPFCRGDSMSAKDCDTCLVRCSTLDSLIRPRPESIGVHAIGFAPTAITMSARRHVGIGLIERMALAASIGEPIARELTFDSRTTTVTVASHPVTHVVRRRTPVKMIGINARRDIARVQRLESRGPRTASEFKRHVRGADYRCTTVHLSAETPIATSFTTDPQVATAVGFGHHELLEVLCERHWVPAIVTAASRTHELKNNGQQWWCYSDSLKAVRDSFPYCPPDTARAR